MFHNEQISITRDDCLICFVKNNVKADNCTLIFRNCTHLFWRVVACVVFRAAPWHVRRPPVRPRRLLAVARFDAACHVPQHLRDELAKLMLATK